MESAHYLLMKAHTLLNQQILARAAALGLTAGQPKLLEYLAGHEGSDQKTISDYCEIRPSTTGSILAGMEKSGLVERRRPEGDRRSLYVYLTEKGRRAAGEMALIFDEAERRALQGLDAAETETLRRLLLAVIVTLEAEKGKELPDRGQG